MQPLPSQHSCGTNDRLGGEELQTHTRSPAVAQTTGWVEKRAPDTHTLRAQLRPVCLRRGGRLEPPLYRADRELTGTGSDGQLEVVRPLLRYGLNGALP